MAGSLLKLEVIRQAAIPYNDTMLGSRHTPFLCVDCVWKVEALAGRPENNQLPLRLELDVNGVKGRWTEDISVSVSKPWEIPAAAALIQSHMRSPEFGSLLGPELRTGILHRRRPYFSRP